MAYCRYCGKELVNGQCDCYEFQASLGNFNNGPNTEYQQAYEKRKTPFLVPSFNLNFSSFSGFISSMRNQSGISEAYKNNGDPYEHNVPIVPDCVEEEENEVVVKQYNLAILRTRLKFMKAEGRMMVTNRRILFRAAGTSLTGNIIQEQEFKLDEIGGIDIHKDYKFSLLSFFGCILLYTLEIYLMIFLASNSDMESPLTHFTFFVMGAIGMVPTFIVYKRFWLKLMCSLVGAGFFFMLYLGSGVLFRGLSLSLICATLLLIVINLIVLMNLMIVCFIPNLVVKIKTNGAINAVTVIGQKSLRKGSHSDEYSGFSEVLPWEDTIMAMNELGTMIDDLQKQGDYAIEKWAR